jgi:Concanavalin A-like lectin/glucanases superfamily
MARKGRLSVAIRVALLLGGACAVVLWQPWHGPIVLSLSPGHGIDTGDLPALLLVALAVAAGSAQTRHVPESRWLTGRWAGLTSAVVLGALLLTSFVDTAGVSSTSLVPSGGATLGGGIPSHADGRRADPVNDWSHVALTYDGRKLRLYVNGSQVSSQAITGTILRTADPLWIGGNRPYGEYFQGLIDEVRVYNRALSRLEVGAEMATPIGDAGTSPAGLVGAYAFDKGSGTVAADASGEGNAGAIIGATWTTHGRFGSALRFDGSGEMVRVPASASLDLRDAMTLSAWSRPSESQTGWRTILHRQTDAYFLAAGGGTVRPIGAWALDDARAAVLVGAAIWFCLVLASGRAGWVGTRRRSWWPPVALFLVGSAVDAALPPSGTLIGPTLLAVWFAVTASHRGEAASMYLGGALFTAATVVAFAGEGGLVLARHDGGILRSAALGLLLVAAPLSALASAGPRKWKGVRRPSVVGVVEPRRRQNQRADRRRLR